MKPMRLHHVGIVLPTLEKAHEFMQNNGLEIDYAGYVDAYQVDLIFTKFGEFASPIEMIIPHSGVLTQFNGGRGGIAHIAFEVDDVEAVRQEMEADCPGCMLEKKAVQGTDDIIVNFRRPTTNQGSSLNMFRRQHLSPAAAKILSLRISARKKGSSTKHGIPCACTISASSCRPWKRPMNSSRPMVWKWIIPVSSTPTMRISFSLKR